MGDPPPPELFLRGLLFTGLVLLLGRGLLDLHGGLLDRRIGLLDLLPGLLDHLG